jgi:hypothetical protein
VGLVTEDFRGQPSKYKVERRINMRSATGRDVHEPAGPVSIRCLWGRCPQAPGMYRFTPETGMGIIGTATNYKGQMSDFL